MESETSITLMMFFLAFTIMFIVHTVYDSTIQLEYIKALGGCSAPLEGLKDK